MAELFADERCSEAILEFLRTTDVGREVPVEKAETESSESGAEQECPRSSASAGCAGDRAGFTRYFPVFIFPTLYFLFGRQWHRIGLVARFPPWPTRADRIGLYYVCLP